MSNRITGGSLTLVRSRSLLQTLALVLGRATPAKKRRSKKAVRFVDFRAVASESPAESIAREREIVARLASDL
jgi:hypothetical protein